MSLVLPSCTASVPEFFGAPKVVVNGRKAVLFLYERESDFFLILISVLQWFLLMARAVAVIELLLFWWATVYSVNIGVCTV